MTLGNMKREETMTEPDLREHMRLIDRALERGRARRADQLGPPAPSSISGVALAFILGMSAGAALFAAGILVGAHLS